MTVVQERIGVRTGGARLVLLIVAVVLFLLAAFGVGTKLGIDLVDLGLALFALAFVF